MRRNKYGNERVVIDGIKFASKREGECFTHQRLKVLAGKARWVLMQVPFLLPGGIKYLLDFLVLNGDGSLDYYDAKGVQTQVYKIKKKQVEAIYGIQIKEW